MGKLTVTIALLTLFFGGLGFGTNKSGTDKKIILPPGAKPGGNYSPGILMGDTLYISGQGGRGRLGVKSPATSTPK